MLTPSYLELVSMEIVRGNGSHNLPCCDPRQSTCLWDLQGLLEAWFWQWVMRDWFFYQSSDCLIVLMCFNVHAYSATKCEETYWPSYLNIQLTQENLISRHSLIPFGWKHLLFINNIIIKSILSILSILSLLWKVLWWVARIKYSAQLVDY